MACRKGHLEVVRLLVEAGADKDKAGNHGSTPLSIARSGGHYEIAKLLVEAGADDNEYDDEYDDEGDDEGDVEDDSS